MALRKYQAKQFNGAPLMVYENLLDIFRPEKGKYEFLLAQFDGEAEVMSVRFSATGERELINFHTEKAAKTLRRTSIKQRVEWTKLPKAVQAGIRDYIAVWAEA